MIRQVSVVDYGIGNLFSVGRALEKVGARVEVTGDPDKVANAEMLLLPGVGAFEPCISRLRDSQLAEPVLRFVATGRPFLGICVGMQLLFDYSNEFGHHKGLGLIAGGVEQIPTIDSMGQRRKIPHIGWSELLMPPMRSTWQKTLLANIEPGLSSAYFVHSFSGVPSAETDRLANVDYQGYPICAAVQKDNITGFQCHPEKSGKVGLKILESFLGS